MAFEVNAHPRFEDDMHRVLEMHVAGVPYLRARARALNWLENSVSNLKVKEGAFGLVDTSLSTLTWAPVLVDEPLHVLLTVSLPLLHKEGHV